MYYILKSIVVFLKFISNLLLLRNFGNIIIILLHLIIECNVFVIYCNLDELSSLSYKIEIISKQLYSGK